MTTRRRLSPAYPALLAAIPVLYRQLQNPWPAVADAVVFSAALATAIALGQTACYGAIRTLRRRCATAPDWAAVLATVGVGLFYCWPPASDAAHALAHQHPRRAAALLSLACAVVLPGLWWGGRRGGAARLSRALPQISRLLGFAATLLAGWFAARIAFAPARLAWIVHNSPFIHALARPVPTTGPGVGGPRRDVYVLVLDAYPAADVLRDTYGIENAPFLDSLRALGFHIPARVRSNYPATLLSIPSLLNFAQLEPLTRELPTGYRDYALGAYLLEHNRAAQFLKARGYQIVFFPSVYFAPTRHNRAADTEFPQPPGVDPARAIWRSIVVGSFAQETLLRRVMRYLPTRQAVVTAELGRTFAGVAALAARPAGGPPVYAFAHLLIPHGEFQADSACRPYPRGTTLTFENPPGSSATRAAFAGFVACANRHVLATARAILARPGPRPVIILQGDHGTAGLGLFNTPTDSITAAQVHERFSPLGAYYLPDGGAAAMGDTVSIVNVLRTVFRHYHGADLPPVPNAMYLFDFQKSYRLTPIDTLTLRPSTNPRLPVAPPSSRPPRHAAPAPAPAGARSS